MGIFGEKYSCIGLDIGSSSIKMAQFSGNYLKKVASKEIPSSIRRDGEDGLAKFLIKSVRELIKDNHFEGRNVSCVLRGPDEINILFFSLPKMQRKDLQGAIEIEIRKGSNLPVENSVHDFYTRQEERKERVSIVSAVSNTAVINSKIALLERANLLTVKLDIIGHAIENVLELIKDESEDVRLFLEMEGNVTTMNFFEGNRLHFSRDLPFGTDDLAQAIAKTIVTPEGRRTLSFEEAEEIIKKHGIITDETGGTIETSLPSSQLAAMMRPFIEKLIREIATSIEHFRKRFGGGVKKILLMGYAGKLKGLDELFRKNLKTEVEVFNPFRKISVQLDSPVQKFEELSCDFVVAAGLALPSKRKFSILPRQTKLLYKLSTVRAGITAILIVFALVLFVSYITTHFFTKKYEGSLKRTQHSLQQVQEGLRAVDELELWKEKVDSREKILSRVERVPLWHGVLKDISNITPEGVAIESIAIGEEPELSLNINGKLASGDASYSEFLENLDSSPFFKDVKLLSRKEAQGGINFEIKCKLLY